ncbi:acyltransferase [Methylotenera sp.]|uniref:acyltransferase family protein n=1 Tax=Methylotenera sp. TaxID=2051956 RepID=UPI002489F45B|nr:acyltransferase [Methylotenera sp.]MDI1361138.1 acyltransferase [Methylotenera sp.]
MSQPYKLKTINALTGVRFLAAMLVFLFHFGAAFSERIGMPTFVSTFLHNGKVGVSMFFVLSGFILTYTYTQKLAHKFKFADFFIARFSRIYPVYLLALLLMLPVLPKALDTWSALCVLAMVQSWTLPFSGFGGTWVMQAWTLSVELFFYICFPLLLLVMRNIKLNTIAVGLLLTSLLIVAFGTPWVDPGVKFVPFLPISLTPILPILRLPEFIFGMLICKLMFSAPQIGEKISSFELSLASLLIIMVLLAFFDVVQAKSLATVVFGILIIQLSYGRNWMVSALSSKIMLLLGGASYALYILQGPIRQWLLWAVDHAILTEQVASLLNPVFAISISIVTFIYFEQPARLAIKRFFDWISTSYLNYVRCKGY